MDDKNKKTEQEKEMDEKGGSLTTGVGAEIIGVLNRLGDIMILSIIFMISCIPVITIGAALSSAAYTAHKAITSGDGYIFRYYTSAFKKNFKQATLLWLPMMVVGGVLGFDVFFWWSFIHSNDSIIYKIILVISIFVLFIYLMVFVNVFALIGNFENPTKLQLKNALLIGINKFPQTLIIIAIYALSVWLMLHQVVFVIAYVLVLSGGFAYLIAFIHKRMFASVMKQAEAARQEIEEEKVQSEETPGKGKAAGNKASSDGTAGKKTAENKDGKKSIKHIIEKADDMQKVEK